MDIGKYVYVCDGLHRQWHENGKLQSEINYKDGKFTLDRRWFDNGQLHQEVNRKDGELNGLARLGIRKMVN